MTTVEIVKVKEVRGATYDRQAGGAACPNCGEPRARVKRTLPWEDGVRVRYHDCQRCGTRFKSLEEDRAPAPEPGPAARGFRSNPYHPLRRT